MRCDRGPGDRRDPRASIFVAEHALPYRGLAVRGARREAEWAEPGLEAGGLRLDERAGSEPQLHPLVLPQLRHL